MTAELYEKIRRANIMRGVNRGMNGSQIAMEIAQQHPDIFSKLYPRIYENVGQYHTPKVLAAFLTEAVIAARMVDHPTDLAASYRVLVPPLSNMVRNRMPLFFLAPDFVQAIRDTDLAEEINWRKMKLPYEEGIMVLPRGTMDTQYGELAYIFWTRNNHDRVRYFSAIPGVPDITIECPSFALTGIFPETGIWMDTSLSGRVRETIIPKLMFEREGKERDVLSPGDMRLTDDDRPILNQISVILIGTLLAMTARPDLVETERMERVSKPKPGSSRKEFWSPNIIGRRYKLLHEGAHEKGTHASPRMHRRRGHFRSQPCGIGFKDRRIVWLEPTWVNLKQEEIADAKTA